MSDELRRVVDDLKGSIRGVYERMDRLETLQRDTAEVVHKKLTENAEGTADVKRHFQTFLTRFDEVAEMLITHDTEQLQRVARVERDYAAVREENDALRQQWQDISRRVEALEKKAR